MCGLVILTFVAVNVQTVWWLSSSWLVGTVLPAVVIDQTNNERMVLSELPLKRNALLDQAAQLKADDMAKNHYFAHNSPTGVTPWHWFDEVSYQYSHAGENLAVHFTDSNEVVKAWMNSPTHRANIVNGSYTEIGVGTAEGEYEGFKTVFVVQLFGTPAAAIQPAKVTTVPVVSTVPSAVKVENKPVITEEVATATPVVLSEESFIPVVSDNELPVVLSEEVSQSVVSEIKSQNKPEIESPVIESEVIEIEPIEPKSQETWNLFAATSSGLVPASVSYDSTALLGNAGSTMTDRYSTMPNRLLQIIYMIVGTIVASLLLISVAISMRYHRPWQLAYGMALLLLMTGLFYLHTVFTAQIVIAASS